MKKVVSLLISLLLIFNMTVGVFASDFDGVQDHWAMTELTLWTSNGVISGYPDGSMGADNPVTRAEVVQVINNLFRFETTDVSSTYTDVAEDAWYKEAIESSSAHDIVEGYADGSFRPDQTMTRENVLSVLYKAFCFADSEMGLTYESKFTDSSSISSHALDAVAYFEALGYINGYEDGSLRPQSSITRAELIKLIDNVVDLYVYEDEVTVEALTVDNALLVAKNVMLKDIVINETLFISEAVGDGDVTLESVTVTGVTQVEGGGSNSIKIINSDMGLVIVDKETGESVRILVTGNSNVQALIAKNAIIIEDKTTGVGKGVLKITLGEEIPSKAIVQLIGDFIEVNSDADSIDIILEGLIQTLNNKGSELVINDEAVASGLGQMVDRTKDDDDEDEDEDDDGDNDGSDWTLSWSDEFSSTEIDASKWTYDLGNWIVDEEGSGISAGWGNNELEYYTNSSDNAYIEDGVLVIKALEEDSTDEFGTYAYTSAKLKTKGLFAQTYGRYEINAKLPVGEGLWPAIWMLPVDDIYGGWAASGEIDIMEGWGSKPDTVAGTLHYGALWPDNKYSGKDYVFSEDTSVNEFHEYAVEWEPGEIRWYVDDVHYQTQNNWSTKDSNDETFSFPAPFDQDFYMILNLAVGGNFDGDPTEDTVFPSTMEVDYVRVYELTGRDYIEAVEPETEVEALPDGAKEADAEGNYISNGDFIEAIQDNAEATLDFGDKWNLVHMDQFGGQASQSIVEIDGSNFAEIDITSGGSQAYSVQLIQLTTLGTGRYYKVSFDAKAASGRSINMKMGGGADAGWGVYSDSNSYDLTDTMTHYEDTFQMTADTDIAARLEFNVGLSADTVWIGHVVVEEVDAPEVDYNAVKVTLDDGNGIYNGTFDKYTIDRLAYWNLTLDEAVASVEVDEDSRDLEIEISDGGSDADAIVVDQQGIEVLINTQYQLSFDAMADDVRSIEVRMTDATDTSVYMTSEVIDLTTESETYTIDFTMSEATDDSAQLIFSLGASNNNVTIDNVSLMATSIDYSNIDVFPLVNGDFADGLESWDVYVHDDAAATVEEVDGEVVVSIDSVGAETWGIQLYQGTMDISKGVDYIVSFEARSTVERNFELSAENSNYTRYLDEIITVGPESTFYEFTFNVATDQPLSLKFIMGNTDDSIEANSGHEIIIDNVVFEVDGAPADTNLIVKNGTFDTDTSNWNIYSADGSDGAMSVVDEALKVVFSAYSGWNKWSTQVYQDIIELESNKTYEVTFDAMSTDVRDIWVEMTDMDAQTISLSDTMTTFTYEFTATADVADGKLNFLLGTDNMDGADFPAGQCIVIDNIAITEVEVEIVSDDAIITNGTFDTATTAWNLYTGDGSNGAMITSDAALYIEFPDYAGWFKWSTQMYQEDLDLEEGITYVLSFDLMGTEDRDIWVEMTDMDAQTITLEQSMTTYTYEFTASADTSEGKLNFLMGTENMDGADFIAGQAIIIDNVEISEKEAVISNGDFEEGTEGWLIYTGDGSDGVMTTTDAALEISFSNYAGWFKWSTQVYQENIELESGESYQLSFDISSTEARDVLVEMNFLEAQTLSLTDEMTTYTYTITATEDTTDGKLNFLLGTDNLDGSLFVGGQSVMIDNVVMEKQ